MLVWNSIRGCFGAGLGHKEQQELPQVKVVDSTCSAGYLESAPTCCVRLNPDPSGYVYPAKKQQQLQHITADTQGLKDQHARFTASVAAVSTAATAAALPPCRMIAVDVNCTAAASIAAPATEHADISPHDADKVSSATAATAATPPHAAASHAAVHAAEVSTLALPSAAAPLHTLASTFTKQQQQQLRRTSCSFITATPNAAAIDMNSNDPAVAPPACRAVSLDIRRSCSNADLVLTASSRSRISSKSQVTMSADCNKWREWCQQYKGSDTVSLTRTSARSLPANQSNSSAGATATVTATSSSSLAAPSVTPSAKKDSCSSSSSSQLMLTDQQQQKLAALLVRLQQEQEWHRHLQQLQQQQQGQKVVPRASARRHTPLTWSIELPSITESKAAARYSNPFSQSIELPTKRERTRSRPARHAQSLELASMRQCNLPAGRNPLTRCSVELPAAGMREFNSTGATKHYHTQQKGVELQSMPAEQGSVSAAPELLRASEESPCFHKRRCMGRKHRHALSYSAELSSLREHGWNIAA